MSKSIVPNTKVIPTLSILPYAEDVFTDHDRSKQFVTLHFRHDGAVQPRILAWISELMTDLPRVGLTASDALQVTLTPRTQPIGEETQWRCLVKVPVKLLSEMVADQQDFVEAVRSRYKPGAS